MDAAAQVLGSTSQESNCEPTTQLLQQAPPTGSGECDTAALASDNPGYEDAYVNAASPPPAPPLRNVIVAVGPGC